MTSTGGEKSGAPEQEASGGGSGAGPVGSPVGPGRAEPGAGGDVGPGEAGGDAVGGNAQAVDPTVGADPDLADGGADDLAGGPVGGVGLSEAGLGGGEGDLGGGGDMGGDLAPFDRDERA